MPAALVTALLLGLLLGAPPARGQPAADEDEESDPGPEKLHRAAEQAAQKERSYRHRDDVQQHQYWLLQALKAYLVLARDPRYQSYAKRDLVLYQIGDLFFEQKDLDQALTYYDRVLAQRGSPVYALALYKRGWIHYRKGELPLALESFRKVIERTTATGASRDAVLAAAAQRDAATVSAQLAAAAPAARTCAGPLSAQEQHELKDLLDAAARQIDDLHQHDPEYFPASESPLSKWRMVGAAACQRHRLKLVNEAFCQLDEPGRHYLVYVCQRRDVAITGGVARLLRP